MVKRGNLSKKKASTKSSTQETVAEKSSGEATPSKLDSAWSKRSLLIAVSVAVVIIIALTIFLLQARSSASDNPVVVSVNGEPIYLHDVQQSYERLPDGVRELYTPELILNQTIDKVLLLQEAKKQGVDVTPEKVSARIEEQAASLGTTVPVIKDALAGSNVSWSEFEDAVREELLLRGLIEEKLMSQVTVSDSEIQTYYSQHADDFSAKEGQVHVRHILVETEEEAQQVADLARKGQDFAALAKQYSTGPTGPSGGDLGFIDESTSLVPEFKDVALQLSVGEVSDPVQTQFGWHVIYRDVDTISLNQARTQIKTTLSEEKAKEAFGALLERLRAEASIRVFKDLQEEDIASPTLS